MSRVGTAMDVGAFVWNSVRGGVARYVSLVVDAADGSGTVKEAFEVFGGLLNRLFCIDGKQLCGGIVPPRRAVQ